MAQRLALSAKDALEEAGEHGPLPVLLFLGTVSPRVLVVLLEALLVAGPERWGSPPRVQDVFGQEPLVVSRLTEKPRVVVGAEIAALLDIDLLLQRSELL